MSRICTSRGSREAAFRDDVGGLLDLPGNHDYWNGAVAGCLPSPSVNPRVRKEHFPGWWSARLELSRHLVAFHGLCSTSGATAAQQVCAVGNYLPQDLAALDASIEDANRLAWSSRREPFHVVVTHHSPTFGSPQFRGIEAGGLAALTGLCQRRKVRGLLTGHAHSRTLAPRGALPPEVRCGTTLQADSPVAKPQERSFLHHVFTEAGDGLEWHVTPWVYFGRRLVRGAFREVPAERRKVG